MSASHYDPGYGHGPGGGRPDATGFAPGFAPRVDPVFLADALEGLGSRPPRLKCKYFYDATGSALFDRITALPDYYPTRTELGILQEHGGAMAAIVGPEATLVEFGAGSMVKVGLLLDRLERPAAFVPIDISGDHLCAAARRLRAERPGLSVTPVVGDFTRPLRLPASVPEGARVGFFPGSTIGNFTALEATRLLRHFRATLGAAARLLVGFDLVKDRDVLRAAYDDAAGVTAAFNLNLLTRLQSELGAELNPAGFAHEARWNETLARIEMHLVARGRQTIRLAGRHFTLEDGQSIHTENSHKFTPSSIRALAGSAGLAPARTWTDPRGWFAVALLVPAAG